MLELVKLLIGGLNVQGCLYTYLNFQLVSERVHLLWFYYRSAILDPCVVVAVMENTMLNCSLSVCENDSMHLFEGCHTNDLVELLKTKKYARIFVHMLEYFEN